MLEIHHSGQEPSILMIMYVVGGGGGGGRGRGVVNFISHSIVHVT